MGFTLRIINAPAEAVMWNANFAEQSFGYDPIADSGWLAIDAQWVYPSNPLGCITLRIWALDADDNVLFDVRNLGPIENGKDYIYDCSTGILTVAVFDWTPLIAIAVLAAVFGMMIPMMKGAFK